MRSVECVHVLAAEASGLLRDLKVRVVKILGENGRYTVLFEDVPSPQKEFLAFSAFTDHQSTAQVLVRSWSLQRGISRVWQTLT